MGLFSKRAGRATKSSITSTSNHDAEPATPSDAVELPSPIAVTSQEQARALLDEVGQLQQAISERRCSADGAELDIIPRLEGVLLFMLPNAASPAQAFDTLVAPLSSWAMSQYATHPDFVSNPASPEAQARLRLMKACRRYRDKYQHLSSDNT